MTAVISSTYDSKYLYFLPITVWTWNKLGIDVICFMPNHENIAGANPCELTLIVHTIGTLGGKFRIEKFNCHKEKEATYAQCSRLYAACLDLPEEEVLVTSDIDMILFKSPMPDFGNWDDEFKIFGADLVPEKQLPICYIGGSVKCWRLGFNLYYGGMSKEKKSEIKLNVKTYQNCLDDLLGDIECENMKANYWAKDQEEAYNRISKTNSISFKRAKEGTQFSTLRYDRDDAYLLDRLNTNTIDFHMPRPGYEEKNFDIILKVLKYHYPNDDLQWMIYYRNQYLKLL